jgi:hypothetical protein
LRFGDREVLKWHKSRIVVSREEGGEYVTRHLTVASAAGPSGTRSTPRVRPLGPSSMLRGEWIDPRLGKTTFGEWAARWKSTTAARKPKMNQIGS